MSVKDLVVYVDPSPAGAARTRLAIKVAQRFGAHLVGLYVVPSPQVVGYVDTGILNQVLAEQAEEARRIAADVEAGFREQAEAAAISAEWRIAEGFVSQAVSLHARYADLAIVGQDNPEDEATRPLIAPQEIVLTCGRPVLVMPYVGNFPELGQRVLVAWNTSREATCAVNDALPLLEGAEQVVVLSINPRRGITEHGDLPGADIALHLARHGVKATIEQLTSSELDVADVILSRAADLSIDLIVMGAYGHSRFRELVIGGATRGLLRHMTAPVLMSH